MGLSNVTGAILQDLRHCLGMGKGYICCSHIIDQNNKQLNTVQLHIHSIRRQHLAWEHAQTGFWKTGAGHVAGRVDNFPGLELSNPGRWGG